MLNIIENTQFTFFSIKLKNAYLNRDINIHDYQMPEEAATGNPVVHPAYLTS